MNFITISGLIIGVIFGFILQRGYFCHLSGFVDLIMFKNKRVLKATIWAILISLIGFHIMDALGIVQLNPKPLWILADIVGGVIFGIGMFLASGCMAGSTFKIGNGYVGYILAAIGMGIGAYITKIGFLRSYTTALQENLKISILGKSPTLSNFLGIDRWVAVIILAVLLIWLLFRMRDRAEKGADSPSFFKRFFINRWGPVLTGVSIGIIQMIAFYASAKSGKNYPISLTGGYTQLGKSFADWDFSLINWEYLLVIGVIIGAIIASVIAGEFRLKLPKLKHIIFMSVGGILLGTGAGIAGGCNVGHTLSGIPQLSIGSILTSAAIFGGLYLMVYFNLVKSK